MGKTSKRVLCKTRLAETTVVFNEAHRTMHETVKVTVEQKYKKF